MFLHLLPLLLLILLRQILQFPFPPLDKPKGRQRFWLSEMPGTAVEALSAMPAPLSCRFLVSGDDRNLAFPRKWQELVLSRGTAWLED